MYEVAHACTPRKGTLFYHYIKDIVEAGTVREGECALQNRLLIQDTFMAQITFCIPDFVVLLVAFVKGSPADLNTGSTFLPPSSSRFFCP